MTTTRASGNWSRTSPLADLHEVFTGRSAPACTPLEPAVAAEDLAETATGHGWISIDRRSGRGEGKAGCWTPDRVADQFPEYTGRNWDALQDDLGDLSWLGPTDGYLVVLVGWSGFLATASPTPRARATLAGAPPSGPTSVPPSPPAGLARPDLFWRRVARPFVTYSRISPARRLRGRARSQDPAPIVASAVGDGQTGRSNRPLTHASQPLLQRMWAHSPHQPTSWTPRPGSRGPRRDRSGRESTRRAGPCGARRG